MAWSYEIYGPRSGDRYAALPLSSVSWHVRVNGQIGSGSAVVQTRSAEFDGWGSTYFKNVTLPWRRVLVGIWDDVPIFSMIITEREYDFSTGELTLSIADIGELMRKRHYFPSDSYSANAVVSLGPYDMESMLRAHALNIAGGGFFGAESHRRMPVLTQQFQSGDVRVRVSQSEFKHPWDWMMDAAAEEDGIDWFFEPSFEAGESSDVTGLRWWFRSGNPMERSAPHHFSLQAPDTPLLSVKRRDNASEYASDVFVVGEGTGEDRPVRRAGSDTSPEVPRVVQTNQESDSARLLRLARGELSFARSTPDTWSFQLPAEYALRRTGNTDTDGVRLGSRITIDYDDRYEGTGQVEMAVVGLSGDGGDLVNVEVQLV